MVFAFWFSDFFWSWNLKVSGTKTNMRKQVRLSIKKQRKL